MQVINIIEEARKLAKLGIILRGLAISVIFFGNSAYAQTPGHMHGGGGHGHDMANMPGLQGENAYPFESAELAVLFMNFETITREVTNLPNGIRTVTRSSDPEVMDVLVSHVHGMINRVEQGDNPKIRIQSPTLDTFFEHADDMTSSIELTDEGIVVVQTSDNPKLIEAMHKHAAEVTELADRGMAAVHEQMMRRYE